MAGVTGRADIMTRRAWPTGWNVLGIAGLRSGLAVLEIIEKENLCARANLLVERFRKRRRSWQDTVGLVGDVEEWAPCRAGTGAVEGDAATADEEQSSITVLLRARPE